MEWIKCSDRFPKDAIDVIVSDGQDVRDNHWYSVTRKKFCDEDGISELDVTHWMPLPMPPGDKNAG